MGKFVRRLRTGDAAGTKPAASAASLMPSSLMVGPAGVTRFGALFLILFFSWASIGNAADAAVAPTKEIRIFNNTDETVYPVLQVGKRDTDEWIQAFAQVGPAEITQRRWPNNLVYRIYINGKQGIAPGHSAIITVPLYTLRVPLQDASKGIDPDLVIDWWNGGRLSIYDQFGSTALINDYNNDLATPGNPVIPPNVDGNLVITCQAGDCRQLDIFAGNTVLPGSDPSQLTEYTFADAITANGAPYPFKQASVGYNISSVDQLYLPLAMEPAGNPLIPYIGSVQTFAEFRSTVVRWLNDNPGWPLYKGFDAAHPRVPEAHIIALDGYRPDGTYNADGPLTAGGQVIQDVATLYAACTGPNPPITATCQQLQHILALFNQNYIDFTNLSCADPNFKNTTVETLRRVYGWVPFNTGCPSGTNALAKTTGITPEKFNQLQEEYIALQYNFMTEQKSERFNPYVELVHSQNYLHMAVYAFSIDDAVGFQHYNGTGLIYAIGGTNGLDNPNELDKKKLVNVVYGHPPNTTLWQSVGICSETADSFDLKPEDPAFDFFPPQYPCLISAKNVDGNIYQFRLIAPPPDLEVSCAGVTIPGWCAQTNVLAPNKVIGASTQ